jgi:hypothetical protein
LGAFEWQAKGLPDFMPMSATVAPTGVVYLGVGVVVVLLSHLSRSSG